MKKKWVFISTVMFSVIAQGQMTPIEGGSTEFISNDWNVPVPWLMVGSNSESNMLYVSGGGHVESQIGILGNNGPSRFNDAFVSGSNAVWNSSMEIAVGNYGADNSMAAFDGGLIETPELYVGKYSTNNFAMAFGEGSEIKATTLRVGQTGAGNGLGLMDGGRVTSENGTLGYWIGSDGNIASAMGAGSVWSNSGALAVGEHGSDNSLMAFDGGRIETAVLNLGVKSYSSNNTAFASGAGAILAAGELNIGGTADVAGGIGNRVSVLDGGRVETRDLVIHDGNELDLNDGGTFAINNDFNASMDGFNWNDGGLLSLTGNLEGMPVEFVFSPFGVVSTLDGEGRALTLDGGSWSNTGNVAVGRMGSNNRLAVTNGGFVSGSGVYVGMNVGSSGNEVLVTGSGSAMETARELIVGYKGHSNSVSVLDGATVQTRGGQLGFDHSNGNSAIVSGAGSRWDSSIGMIIGQTGRDNTVLISDGGVVGAMQSTVGYFAGADSNAVVVTGKDSLWENENGLYLGVRKIGSTWYNGGQGNSLTVENAAKVLVGNVDESQVLPYIGNESAIAVGDSTGNADMVVGNGSFVNTGYGIIGSAADERGAVVVTDTGTVWSNRDDMYVGYAGSGNELTIRNGGRIENGYGLVGWVSGSDSNQVTVTGAGSVWESTKELRIGGDGAGNRLDVVNGGMVISAGGVVGRSRGGDGNVASISGSGSVWNAGSDMSVGAYGDDNLLEIKNGGLVVNIFGRIGDGEGTGNLVRISGEGSVWSNTSTLFVGSEGDYSRMEILDGGRVENVAGRIGQYGAYNSVLVSDSGSVWNNSGALHIGEIAGGNSLVVSNAGQVVSGSGSLGAVLNSHNNNVTVTGAGSEWINRGGLTVGAAGRNNSMDILDGGLVISANGTIGNSSLTSGNRVTVSGSGSMWSNTANLTVGYTSGNNLLEIAAGGHVYSEVAMVGGNGFSANGNQVDVSGAGSLWESGGLLIIGNKSDNNILNVTDGGRVEDQVGIIGYDRNSSGNSATVYGHHTVWHNREAIYLGGHRSGTNLIAGGTGNLLTVEDGGLVLVGDVDTNYLNHVNSSGGIVVGDASGMAEMIVANESIVTSGGSVIGLGANDTGSVLITGQGTEWNLTGSLPTLPPSAGALYVGHQGSNNRLTIADGASVVSGTRWLNPSVIGMSEGSTGNVVVVSGAGSVWDMASESDYSLPPLSPGLPPIVPFEFAELVQTNINPPNLSLSVIDEFVVGNSGSHNQLIIEDGGLVRSRKTSIGRNASANSNLVVVAGEGSVFHNKEALYLGGIKSGTTWYDGGVGNRMIVQDGGLVLVGDVDTNNIPSHYVDMGALVVGDASGNKELHAANQSVIDVGNAIIGLSSNESGTVTLTSGTRMDVRQMLFVGHDGSGSDLNVSEGAELYSSVAYIGLGQSATGNVANVEGGTWDVNEDLYLGEGGSGNELNVVAGGQVNVQGSGFIGLHASASNNSLRVSGAGSVVTSGLSTDIGNTGAGNSMNILDGGHVYGGAGVVGLADTSDNNQVVVTGTGSVWSNRQHVMVGGEGSGNSLGISDGGVVHGRVGIVGAFEGGDHNAVMIEGAGSAWSNRNDLVVGQHGSGNLIKISDGGVLYSKQAFIGDTSTASGNTVQLSGVGSKWINDELIQIGYEGSGNRLDVMTGGTAFAANVIIGNESATNILEVTAGGHVVSTSAIVGNTAKATGNRAVVSGANSDWINSGDLLVGNYSSGNSLEISDGGSVNNEYTAIGTQSGSSSNRVLVTGAGSEWNLSGNLSVGLYGSDNSMRVEDGGRVISSHGTIGNEIGSDDNAVVITGGGSVWSNQYNLNVGGFGSGNSLEITDGGKAISDVITMGELLGAGDNSIWVEGVYSKLVGSSGLYVGLAGSGNMLTITNGGYVESGGAYIGHGVGASDNAVRVSDNGAYWFSDGGLSVGHDGSNNELIIENGGVVQTWGSSAIGYGASATSNAVVVRGEGAAFGTGVMVPRRAVLNPLPPPYVDPIGGGGGSVIIIETPPIVGLPPGVGNPIIVTNGGSVATGGEGIYVPYNHVNISDGGSYFRAGSGYSSGSVAVGGSGLYLDPISSITISNRLFIPPSQYMIEMSMGDLAVGREGSYNTLDVEEGGLAASWNVFVGETSNAWFNAVTVTGTNSELHAYNDLSLGGRMSPMYVMTDAGWENDWIAGGRGNALYVGDGGLVTVGRDFDNRNYSSVSVDPGAAINVASNYYQDATSSLRFGVATNAAGAPLNALVRVGGTAEFEQGARIEYASDVGQLQFDVFHTNKIIEAEKLIVAGKENPDSLDLEMLDASGTLVDVLFWENDADIYGLVGRVRLADSAGFDTNSMMGRAAREIDDLSLLGQGGAGSTINLLNTMTSAQQNQQLSQLLSRGAPNYLHGQSMTEGMDEIKKHSTRQQAAKAAAPKGAKGPYDKDQELQAWVKPYGAWSDYSANNGFSGYDHNIYGTVVGFDKPLETALLGIAGGYGRSVISQDDGDHSEAKTGYGVVYLNWGTQDWFSHANLAFGRSKISQNSGTAFGNEADFHASNFAAYIGGGKEIAVNRRFSVTPKASMLWSYYYQEGHQETSANVEREIAAYERNSFLSTLGAAAAFRKEYDVVTLKPEARLYWLHEFNSDVENIDYQFVNGMGGQYHFAMPAPEENVLETGLGISALFNDELELVLDVDWRFGQNYSGYALSGRVVYEF